MDKKKDLYTAFRTYLCQQLEWNTVQMAITKDDNNGQNMHTFYHGHVNAIEYALRELTSIKAKLDKEEEK